MCDDFYIDVPEIDCWVRFDPELEERGIVRTVFPERIPNEIVLRSDGVREIALRDYNDVRVLLHEVLHRLIQTNPDWDLDFNGRSRPLSFEEEERLVQHITAGLYAMGWFWSYPEGQQPESEAS